MRSTAKKPLKKNPRKGRQMRAVYIRIPQDIHKIVTDLSMKMGKSQSQLYRSLIEDGLRAAA